MPGLGLGTCFQVAPFQCAMRVCSTSASENLPTAHASHGDSTVTAARTLPPVPTLGGCPPVHAVQVAACAAAAGTPTRTHAAASGAASTLSSLRAGWASSCGRVMCYSFRYQQQ